MTCFGKGVASNTIFKLNKTCKNGMLCTIGNDVWIGSHVRIMEGGTIGDGAIIGAGAIVTKDIPPYSISVGVPAKVIKFRFQDKQIEQLQKVEWGNWDDKSLKKRVDSFSNINTFLCLLKKI